MVATQTNGVVCREALKRCPTTTRSPDPFSPDPFSPEPVTSVGNPSAPPPVSGNPPPAPCPSGRTARRLPVRNPDSVGMSPITVFIGSYAFAGIAAVLLATTIALLVALSDFRASGLVIIALAVASVAVATVVLWLGLLDERGRRWARTTTWAVRSLRVRSGRRFRPRAGQLGDVVRLSWRSLVPD